LTAGNHNDQAAAAAFKALQAKARIAHGGNTQPLLVVYAVEAFLRRLATSDHAERMALKGGMLLAANDIRQFTKDADLSTHGLPGDEDNVRQLVAEICAIQPEPHDGVTIDPDTIRTNPMREGDDYEGVRCKLVATLGKAQIPFALDLSFGDSERATVIQLKSVINQPAVRLRAYPLALNLAEKIVTAMQRRETNTRDRDFADLWVTSRGHQLDATELREHVRKVADHRGQPIITMAQALTHMPDRQQPYAAMVARMSYLSPPPDTWRELIDGVIAFLDPILGDEDRRFSHWDNAQLRWDDKTTCT
jgi:predicted nucleotidyltransferase component of viral defense system